MTTTPEVPTAAVTFDPVVAIARLQWTLNALPRDGRALSRQLRLLGVRGRPGSIGRNALAMFLRARCGCEVSITPYLTIEVADDWQYHQTIPRWLRAFIDAETAGEYPWLEGEPSPGIATVAECHVMVVE